MVFRRHKRELTDSDRRRMLLDAEWYLWHGQKSWAMETVFDIAKSIKE